MDKKELNDFLDKIIRYFYNKYIHFEIAGDVEQCVVDAIFNSLEKMDFNRPHSSLFTFIEKRLKYYLLNMWNAYKKRCEMIEKYAYEVNQKNEPDYCLYILMNQVKEMCKYDILPALLGTETAKQCAVRNNISVDTVRYHLKKVKRFLRKQLK